MSAIHCRGRLCTELTYRHRLHLSSYEPDDFIKSVSGALLALPRLAAFNINFLDPKAHRTLPIIKGLKSVKLSWPVSESDPMPSLGGDQASIYHAVLGLGSNIRRLEISARRRQRLDYNYYKLPPLLQIEELVLENVPIVLSGEAVQAMPRLQSISLRGFDCFNCDPYAAVWSSLTSVRRGLRAISIDVVGPALVNYLASYQGLETLVLKLGKNANDYCVKDLCSRAMKYHIHSLKSLHIDLHPHADFQVTWFFEYWVQWIPRFSGLRILKMTTSMNLISEFDAGVLLVSTS